MPLLWLIGMMGSGKSSAGPLIAAHRDVAFVDTDAEVERRTGMTIAEFWYERGEAAFRACEAAVVAEVAQRLDDAVVAAGGGAVLNAESVALMRAHGLVVWLAGDPGELAARLADDGSRPLLAGVDLETRLDTLMSERSLAYRRAAHLVIDTTGKTPAEVAGEVEALWNES